MFSYCDNNSVNREDSDGHYWGMVLAIASIVVSPEVIAGIGIAATVGTLFYIGCIAYDNWDRHNTSGSLTYGNSGTTSVTYSNSNKGASASSTKPKSYTSPGAGRSGAFRDAKRKSGIPVSQQPVKTRPAVDKRGKSIPGIDYDFGDGKVIRDHSGGHTYPDDPAQDRGPHINDVYGNHYDYFFK